MVAVAVGVGGMLVAPVVSAKEAAPLTPRVQLASTSAADRTKPANGYSGSVDITPDGRYLTFQSSASDLVASPASGGASQVYLRDTATGSVRMISVTTDGLSAGNAPSYAPAISDDGKRVAFITSATNLVAGAGASAQAVVWDWEAASLTVVSVQGSASADREVTDLDLSGNGKVVAFSTSATNLAAIPTYDEPQVYRRDLVSSSTLLISSGSDGRAAAAGASEPSVSFDGSSIAFSAKALETVNGSSPLSHVFCFRSDSGSIDTISGNLRVFGNADASSPSISADGLNIAFASASTNLLEEPIAGGTLQVYFRWINWSRPNLVSRPTHRGGIGNGDSFAPAVSADGNHVAFVSSATNLAPGADQSVPQLFLTDAFGSRTELASKGLGGRPADAPVLRPAVSGDGELVAFESESRTLVTGSSGHEVFLGVPAPVEVRRIGGADRYAVSAATSAATFPVDVPVAYIASGEGFADALSGASMAGVQSGPVLLTMKNRLPEVILDELKRVKPARIVVLGGVSTISTDVESALRSLSPVVTRVAGADRFATSALVSASLDRGGAFHVGQAVYVASGENYPDALAASPIAGRLTAPVLLTARAQVASEVLAEVRRLTTAQIFVLGGVNSVSDHVVDQLDDIAPVRRLQGADRYATAAQVSGTDERPGGVVYVASGETYPDALSGGSAAIQTDSPLLLVTRNSIPDVTKAELSRLAPTRIVVLGGPDTVSDLVVSDLDGFLAR